jgi:acyl-CoA reductase-like NAD-dependent aldehyde dehydrogenase
VKAFVAETKKLILGDPRQSQTTLGPLVKVSAADFVREQIGEAIKLGAKTLISETDFNVEGFQKNYLAPQVLMDVNHQMSLMTEENFGPVVGIMSVSSDEEAIALMNDSSYGLTASIWSKDITKAERLCAEVETGTCFVNRCDYLDPALAWTGVKDTGIGCSLSVLGFDAFTRPKSIHIRA